jgi:hypothetical protein
MGFARLAESSIRSIKGKREGESLGALDKILASSIGGALATWNQPIEGTLAFALSVAPHSKGFSLLYQSCFQLFELKCNPP